MTASAKDFSSYKRLVELGRLYGGADNYTQAEAAYRDALAIETRLFGPDAIAVGETLAELALQVSNQQRFDEAAALFHRAMPIVAGSQSACGAGAAGFLSGARRRQPAPFFRRAQLCAPGDGGAARGRRRFRARHFGQPRGAAGELAHSLRIEAEMALRLDDLASAQAAADEALWIVSEEPGLPLWWRPDAVALMGEVNEREGRVVVAERDFRDAYELDRKLFGDTAPTARGPSSGSPLSIATSSSIRPRWTPIAPPSRSSPRIGVARAQVTQDQIVPFITAATATGGHDLDAEMFTSNQLAGSDVADQTIAHVAARRAVGDPALADLVRQADEAARTRDKTRMDLAAEFAKTSDERNGAREQKLDADVKIASLKADQLVTKLHSDYPAYASLADPGPGKLSDVIAGLAPGEAFLSFAIGPRASYALLVTSKGPRRSQARREGGPTRRGYRGIARQLRPQAGPPCPISA